jgi:chemotaxis protein methyltransferase CheR
MMNGEIIITDYEYNLIRDFIYKRFGIALGDKKKALVTGRLQKILRQSNFKSFQAFYEYVLNDKTGKGIDTLINRISTNHTYFNRENKHFEYFKNTVLPWAAKQELSNLQSKIRVWSAGCSSGEESYTLAILVYHYLKEQKENIKGAVLATDISDKVLQMAVRGIYSKENYARLKSDKIKKSFIKQKSGSYAVDQQIKDLVLHRRLNLMRNEFPFKKKFHSIFCRNVMIYFDNPTREVLIKKFYDNLHPGGYLFVGLSESLGRRNEWFQFVQPSVYRKNDEKN